MAKGKKSATPAVEEAADSPQAPVAPAKAPARKKTAGESPAPTESAASAKAAKAPAGRKPAAAKKANKPAAPASTPLIDTALAAEAAARMLAQRGANTGASPQPQAAGAPAQPAKSSSTFERIKNNIGNPSAGLSNILGGAADQKKSHQAFGNAKQSGRGQSFGSGANRFGVPRRTNG